MHTRPRTPEETYGPALKKAKLDFRSLDPARVAVRADVPFQYENSVSGLFEVLFLGTTYQIEWPSGNVRRSSDMVKADIATQILLLHYLLTADGRPLSGQWIAFRSLPGGLGYYAAFQGRANLRLADTFGHDQQDFEDASSALMGERLTFGDASYLFRALPRVWLAVVLYLADEEFPASANVLFDAAASHYLPTEDLAVLGGILAGRLVKQTRKRTSNAPRPQKTP